MKNLYFKLLSIILISSLGIIVYSNTFHCAFHIDDITSIVDNFAIRDIHNLQAIWNFWPCRFITYFTLALNYHLGKLNVSGYHLFNLCVHLITSILVWWLTLLTLPLLSKKLQGNDVIASKAKQSLNKKKIAPLQIKRGPAGAVASSLKNAPRNDTNAHSDDPISQHAALIALFVGLVFVSHPLQTQAVTYIVQRAACMAALFYLASLCFYVKARLVSSSVIARSEGPQAGHSQVAPTKQSFIKISPHVFYACSLLAAVAAMFTKENSITLPFAILLYEFFFLRPNSFSRRGESTGGGDWKILSPFLLTLSIIPLTMMFTQTVDFQGMHRIAEKPSGISSMQYLLTQCKVIVTYIRLFFLPLNQNADYDVPLAHSLFELPVLTGFLFLIAVLWQAKQLFLKHRLLSFSIFWFFLTLLPESSIVPIKDVIFEHRLYLPLAGYSLFLVSGAYYLLGKKMMLVMIVFLTSIIVGQATLAYQRNNVWKDESSLWDDVIKKSPHKPRGYNNRGNVFAARGNFFQALSDYNKAIKADPNFSEGYYNRGGVEASQGKLNLAMTDYDKALELNHEYPEAYINRGYLYYKQGKLTEALLNYNKALSLTPTIQKVYIDRGLVYAQQGDLTDAIADYTKALELEPNDAETYNALGLIFAKTKSTFTQAISNYDKATQINPEYAEAYNNRGVVFAQQNNLSQAIDNFTKAVTIEPKYAGAYNNLAISYYQLKKFPAALKNARMAQSLGYAVNPALINVLEKN